MKSIASAPGKIILFGEHFVVHGTEAILAAIDKRVTVTSSFTEDKTVKVNSQLGMIEVPIGQKNYFESDESMKEITDLGTFAPFVYLARMFWNFMSKSKRQTTIFNKNGIEITIDSDIPVGVGLGSSSACCVAATASILNLFIQSGFAKQSGYGIDDPLAKSVSIPGVIGASGQRNRKFIEERARHAESTIFPSTSGADSEVCTSGGIIRFQEEERNPAFNRQIVYNLPDINIIIANSMITHSTKDSVEKVKRFKENNEERFSQLCDLENGLIGEVIVAMKTNDATTLGLKMSENQKYLEEIQVSNDTLRDMMSSLKEISLGTKITGAGDGGCIIALVKDENVSKVSALLGKDKECFSAKIDTKGVVWSKIEK